MVTFRNNNNRRPPFRSNNNRRTQFRSNNEGSKFSNNDNFQRKVPVTSEKFRTHCTEFREENCARLCPILLS